MFGDGIHPGTPWDVNNTEHSGDNAQFGEKSGNFGSRTEPKECKINAIDYSAWITTGGSK
jgi:hypothetical protein